MVRPSGSTYATALYTPSATSRRERRRRATAVRRRLAARAKDEAPQVEADLESADPAPIPARGRPGPAAGRAWRRLRLPPHRATSDVLAGAYPFLAEAGLGPAGVFIGQDAWSGGGFCFDPWVLYGAGVLTNPNCLLAGSLGRGKSTLAKALATRSVCFGRKVYVPGDPKG
ncbi:MAG: hypothetical protein ACRDOD_17615, partial [Streptosporangiaceae bacterium]